MTDNPQPAAAPPAKLPWLKPALLLVAVAGGG